MSAARSKDFERQRHGAKYVRALSHLVIRAFWQHGLPINAAEFPPEDYGRLPLESYVGVLLQCGELGDQRPIREILQTPAPQRFADLFEEK